MSLDDPRVDAGECDGNAAPYVLGSLSEDQHEAFRRHLDSCAVCREEVGALQVVAAALHVAAPQVKAPSGLKRRVMATVEGEARLRERHPAATVERARLRPAAGRWSGWRPNLAVASLLAAAVAALAVVTLAGGGGGETHVIRAQVLVPRARAWLTVSGGHAQLEIAGMPEAGAGRVYEVWRKRTGAPQPTDALFTVSSRGSATVGIPGGVAGVGKVLVTSEPRGGSLAPTTPPVIVARI
jgi:anti-sigma-K factor RskA